MVFSLSAVVARRKEEGCRKRGAGGDEDVECGLWGCRYLWEFSLEVLVLGQEHEAGEADRHCGLRRSG